MYEAVELLDKLSEACSREGGGSEVFGVDGSGGGGGGLVADARRATEKAITRYACTSNLNHAQYARRQEQSGETQKQVPKIMCGDVRV